jgi:hypothetical protein
MEVFDSVDEFIAWIDLILSRLNGSDIYATYVWNDAWHQAAFNATHFGLPSEPDNLAHLRGYMLSPDSREAELIRNQLRARLSAIRVALTGQAGNYVDHNQRAKLAKQWRSLADRFRRIAGNDCSEADVKAAAAAAGQLLPATIQLGPNHVGLLPSNAELQQNAGRLDVIEHLWSACWTNFVCIDSRNPSRRLPNALALRPTESAWLQTDCKGWRIRAESYAAVCDALADELAAGGSVETATNGQDDNTGDDPPAAAHSPDFRSVNWFGTKYRFTPNQAACVQVLWGAWERGVPDVGGETLLQAADASTQRIDVVFRGNAAWGTMIVGYKQSGGTKGSYRLTETIAECSRRPKRKVKKTSARARK